MRRCKAKYKAQDGKVYQCSFGGGKILHGTLKKTTIHHDYLNGVTWTEAQAVYPPKQRKGK